MTPNISFLSVIGKNLLACSKEAATHEVKGEHNEGASDFTLDPCGIIKDAGERTAE
jgi:hypothetical protein